jgi:hypothetical protein
MNPWDLFTYIMVVLLGGSAVVIFVFFLRDVGGVLKGQQPPSEPGNQD